MSVQVVVVKRPRGGLFALVRSVPAWLRAFWLGHATTAPRRSTAARTIPRPPAATAEGDSADALAAAPIVDEESLRALVAEHGGSLERSRDGLLRLEVASTEAGGLLRRLREEPALGFDRLRDLTILDRSAGAAPEPTRLEVVYLLAASKGPAALRVHATGLDPAAPEIATVVSLWPGAEWLEREAFDLFGVRFRGHPGLQRILLPIDFDGFPLRKDFVRARAERLPATTSARPEGGAT